ncbi:MAG TPA: Fur family transcriptional regulator [Nocardioidaceae bacterium]|nr:Fur family transcriptional regulator [Nocardioidaceae bacterium]
MLVEPSAFLRDSGLRVTKQRVAVLTALAEAPHSVAETVLARVRDDVGQVSTQAVYDVLNTLTDRGLLRRIQPAGSSARYELRVGDNHHHVVCRRCGAVADIDCATETAPCLEASDLDQHAPGFVVDEAEVTFWGVCATCSAATATD